MASTGSPQGVDDVYYDGECGLCHAFVRFAVVRDPDGTRFRFGPLQGATFQARVAAAVGASLPDSVILLTSDGRLLLRSAAVIRSLERIGGLWTAVARMLRVIPRPLRDAAYDLVARTRRHLFRRPGGLCPITPPAWRDRFLP